MGPGARRGGILKPECIRGHSYAVTGKDRDGHCSECRRARIARTDIRVKRAYQRKRRATGVAQADQREWRKANPDKQAAAARRLQLRGLGWAPEYYDAVWEAQGGACAICRRMRAYGEPRFHADHDHAQLKTRGILCGTRNQGLGLFKDNPQHLQAAVRYLEAHA